MEDEITSPININLKVYNMKVFRLNVKLLTTIFVFILGLTYTGLKAKDNEPISLSESIGTEIDSSEKKTYHLFPDIKNFQKGEIVRLSESKFRLDYTWEDFEGTHNRSRKISKEAVDLTRSHVELTENYLVLSKSEGVDSDVEANLMYRLALKYASEARYDLSSVIISDLVKSYPESPQTIEAKKFRSDIFRLLKTKKALIFKGALLDQSGRTELLVFSGYYGVWLGIATPVWLEAESAEAYGLGLILGGPVSLAIAHQLTRDANVTEGKATMISLGGHLGTWQGIGWSAMGDMDANDVVGVGEICGLVGIGAATFLANQIDFSEGHASLTSSGLEWGAWFGLVLAAVADHEGDELLRDMLLGSDIAILGTGIATKNVKMSETRVRLINLGGVIGTVFGLGIDLLGQVDESSTALAIAGAGSVAGLAAATNFTKNYDKGKELSRSNLQFPTLAFYQNPQNQKEIVPTVGFQLNF